MDKFYFAAKIQQEYADTIRKKAITLGVSQKNIKFNPKGCNFLEIGVYIKFEDKDAYEKFKSLELPGIIETW